MRLTKLLVFVGCMILSTNIRCSGMRMGRQPICILSCNWQGHSLGTRDHHKEVARRDPPPTHTHTYIQTYKYTYTLPPLPPQPPPHIHTCTVMKAGLVHARKEERGRHRGQPWFTEKIAAQRRCFHKAEAEAGGSVKTQRKGDTEEGELLQNEEGIC